MYHTCNICKSGSFSVLFEKNSYEIIKCERCGLIKTNFNKEFDPEGIYNDSYFQGGQEDGYANYEASQKVIKVEFERVIKYLRKRFPGKENKRLLEIGCAYGYFLDVARKYYDCSGIEVSGYASAIAKERHQDIFCGTISEFSDKTTGIYDIVVMLDVIEHLLTPDEDLTRIFSLMNPGGVLCLTTGNIDSLYAKISGKHWRLMTPPQHLYFYSAKTISRLLNNSGFEILSITAPYKIVPAGLALYQIVRRTGLSLPGGLLDHLNKIWIPVNLFDAIRVVAVKQN